MTVPAFAFSVAAAASCQFLVLGPDSKSRQDRLGLGLFRYESPVDGSCVQYSESFRDEYFDAAIEISRWVAVMACVLIGVALLVLVVAKLIVGFGYRAYFGACTWNLFRCCIYLGLYCTLFSFFIFGWDYCKDFDDALGECSMGSTGIVSVVNVVCLLALVSFGFFVNPAGSSTPNARSSTSPGAVEDAESSNRRSNE